MAHCRGSWRHHLDASKLKAHHSRPVTTDILHITGVIVVLPGKSIERIVLMSEHVTLLPEGVKPFHQLLCLRLLRLSLLCRSTGYNCYSRYRHCQNLLHIILVSFVSVTSSPTRPIAPDTRSAMSADMVTVP